MVCARPLFDRPSLVVLENDRTDTGIRYGKASLLLSAGVEVPPEGAEHSSVSDNTNRLFRVNVSKVDKPLQHSFTEKNKIRVIHDDLKV